MNNLGLAGGLGRAVSLGFKGLDWDRLVDTLPVGIYTCDLSGRLVQYNQHAATLWGRSPDVGGREYRFCGACKTYELDGRDLLPEETPMAQVLRTGEALRARELIVERPDFSRIFIHASVEPLFDESGAIIGGVNCFQDITARKQAEIREARDTEILRAVFETTPECIKIVSSDGTLLQMNSAGRQMVEAGSQTALEGALIFDVIAPEHRDRWIANHQDVCRGNKLSWEFDIIGLRGTRRHMEAHAVPLAMPDGSLAQLAITRDVTMRKLDDRKLLRRVNEQTALYQFTDRLYRAETLQDVYEAGLDAIQTALRCDRASLLFFDEMGVMRFAAWRGLSDAYRRAVEGHSPWTPEETDPSPICMSDLEAAELSESLRATIATEGIRALAFIPMVARGKVIGKFMTYYEAPHSFTADEMDLAVTIARQLGFSVERKRVAEAQRRAEQGLRENEERLRLATQTGKVGLWDWDIVHDRLSWTDSQFAIMGLDKNDFEPTVDGFFTLVHADDRDRVREALARTLRDDVPYEIEFRIMRPDGRRAWLFANASAFWEGNRPVRLLGATFDITERKEAEAQRALLVAELSHRVKNTLATVVSIAHQSFSRGQPVDEARRSFAARIQALAQTHSRLADAAWSGVSFRTMLHDELAPYLREDGGNVRLSGPDLMLNSKTAVTLGMAFHELVTNAVKHGALSRPEGCIEVTWTLAEGQLAIQWIESHGPKVSPPRRSGFGRLLLERALAADLRGDVQLNFAAHGLECRVSLPL
jgi:PAS domain S-box-containing protein